MAATSRVEITHLVRVSERRRLVDRRNLKTFASFHNNNKTTITSNGVISGRLNDKYNSVVINEWGIDFAKVFRVKLKNKFS